MANKQVTVKVYGFVVDTLTYDPESRMWWRRSTGTLMSKAHHVRNIEKVYNNARFIEEGENEGETGQA